MYRGAGSRGFWGRSGLSRALDMDLSRLEAYNQHMYLY